MRHMTPLDAFNAAAGFTNQTLGFLTKEKQYELDTTLYEQSIQLSKKEIDIAQKYAELSADVKRQFQQNPQDYDDYMNQQLADWYKTAGAAGNGSRYYTDRLERLKKRGEADLKTRTQEAFIETERQQTAVTYERKRTAILNDPNLNQEERLRALRKADEEYLSFNTEDAKGAAGIETGTYATEFNLRLLEAGKGAKTTKEIEDRIDAVFNTRNEKGEYIFRDHVSNAKDLADKMKKAETEQLRLQNDTAFLEKAAAYDNEITQYRQTKDAGYLQRAEAIANAKARDGLTWRQLRDAIKDENPQYAGEYKNKPRLMQTFEEYKDTGRERGEKPTAGEVEGYLQQLVDQTAAGKWKDKNGNVKTFYDLKENEVEAVWAQLPGEYKDYFKGDMLAFKTEFYANVFNQLQTYIDANRKNNPGSVYILENTKHLFKEIKDQAQLDVLVSFMNDVAYSVRWDTFDEKQYREKAEKVRLLVKAGNLPGFNKLSDGNDAALASAVSLLKNNPEVVFSDADEKTRFLSPDIGQDLTNYRRYEEAALQKVFGGKLAHAYPPEEGQQRDIAAVGHYKLLDAGEFTGMEVRLNSREAKREGFIGGLKDKVFGAKNELVYEYREPGGEWKEFNLEKPASAMVSRGQQNLDDAERIEIIAALGRSGPPPSSIRQEDWDEYTSIARAGLIQDYLKKLENPNPEKFPPEEWEAMKPEENREAIFKYFGGER